MTKDHLQATVEELETSNEELKSSNEELLSANEELQSANEELQTSKEEMQSINEELETINAELTQKVEELDLANSDLRNLFQSTQIPTLFLDADLRIKRFTAAATDVFRLIDTDVGRPISDIASRFEGDLMADLKEVFRTLVPRERTVKVQDGSGTYLLRVLPYRRLDSVIDGLVVTYTDVTDLDKALEARTRLAAIVESSQDAIVGWSLDGAITTWNPAATRMFGHTAAEATGQHVSLILSPGQQREMDDAAARVRQGEAVPPFESVQRTKEGQAIRVSVAISPVKGVDARSVAASAVFRDISDLRQARESAEERARASPARPQARSRPYGVLLVEDNTDSAESLRTLLEMAGYSVQVAGDGPTALAAARSFRPEVVLCDVGLPGQMDGYGVAAALRKAGDGPPPYLIALTGYGQPADRDRAREAGFDRHLTKPADPAALRRLLEDIRRTD
jgi:two-component system CheB/CheR fusion protein